jgi:hypothetical protein
MGLNLMLQPVVAINHDQKHKRVDIACYIFLRVILTEWWLCWGRQKREGVGTPREDGGEEAYVDTGGRKESGVKRQDGDMRYLASKQCVHYAWGRIPESP